MTIRKSPTIRLEKKKDRSLARPHRNKSPLGLFEGCAQTLQRCCSSQGLRCAAQSAPRLLLLSAQGRGLYLHLTSQTSGSPIHPSHPLQRVRTSLRRKVEHLQSAAELSQLETTLPRHGNKWMFPASNTQWDLCSTSVRCDVGHSQGW